MNRNQLIAIAVILALLGLYAWQIQIFLPERDYFWDVAKSKASEYMPHGGCWQWDLCLISRMVIGGTLTFASYMAISTGLVVLVFKRHDIEGKVKFFFSAFALFVFLCGVGHLVDVSNIWTNYYWLEANWDLLTGVVSVIVAIAFFMALPYAINTATPKQTELLKNQLAAANAAIEQHDNAVAELAKLEKIYTTRGETSLAEMELKAMQELDKSARDLFKMNIEKIKDKTKLNQLKVSIEELLKKYK